MSCADPIYGRALEGEIETEICLSVRVQYRRDSEGTVEVTHVVLEPSACLPEGTLLLWQRLALQERAALQKAAEADAAAR